MEIAVVEFLKEFPRPDIDVVTVTEGPGLEPALWIGINVAQILAHVWGVPIIPANHMEGHITSVLVKEGGGGEKEEEGGGTVLDVLARDVGFDGAHRAPVPPQQHDP